MHFHFGHEFHNIITGIEHSAEHAVIGYVEHTVENYAEQAAVSVIGALL
jgi:hypothetical protein